MCIRLLLIQPQAERRHPLQITSNMTAEYLANPIRSVEDLPGRRVATWDLYVPQLAKRGIKAIPMPWDTLEDEQAMLEIVRK